MSTSQGTEATWAHFAFAVLIWWRPSAPADPDISLRLLAPPLADSSQEGESHINVISVYESEGQVCETL